MVKKNNIYIHLSEEEKDKRLKWYEEKYGPYIEKRGLHNWKNLFRKPTGNDFIVLVMIFFMLFLAYAYMRDTKMCKETIQNYIAYFNATHPTVSNPALITSFPFNFSIQNSSIGGSN